MEFGAELAFGLEPGEVLTGEAEFVTGVGSGAVDLYLNGRSGLVLLHRVEAGFEGEGEEVGFDEGATAETPGGVEDFHGVGALDGGGGDEVRLEGVAEFVVLGLFFGADEVAGREEAEGDGVLGDGGLAFGGSGAGGVPGVGLVGGESASVAIRKTRRCGAVSGVRGTKVFLEMIQVEEEGFFGFSGEANVERDYVAVFVICHPGSSVQQGLAK